MAASKLNLAFIQVSSGMFKEAFESLESVTPALLDSASRAGLYFTKARAYSDLADFSASDYYRPAYTAKAVAYSDTGLALLVLAFAAMIFRQLRRLQRAKATISAINQTIQETNTNLNQLKRQLSAANHKLNEANAIKDKYIGYYFNITSEYINRIEGFSNALDKLLANKHYNSTQRIVDSITIKCERNDLFKGFDGVFLKLFPHFVADFNKLLKAEEPIHLTEDQLLTAELRLFALVRLGIDDSDRISKIWGYTINTVYTYKARAKKKSGYPSEEFEERVRATHAA